MIRNIKASTFLTCLIVGMFLLFFINPSMAATFCVGSSAELITAITVARTNSQDDLIQVQQGTYYGNFIYASTEAFGVTIKKGYTANCTSREVDPTNLCFGASIGKTWGSHLNS